LIFWRFQILKSGQICGFHWTSKNQRCFSFRGASIWDRTNIILIVTGVEVVIGNCLPVYQAPLCRYGASKIMTMQALWRSRDVIDHVTIRLAVVDFLWVVHLAPLWRYGRLKFFQEGSSRNRGRSSVGPQYYTDLIYSSSLH